jgi:hypothetical protein
MAEKDFASLLPDDAEPAEEFVLFWRNPDGSVASGHSLPKERAEQMARIFSKMYPDQTYWMEPVRVTPPRSYMGVTRKPNLGPGKSDHEV